MPNINVQETPLRVNSLYRWFLEWFGGWFWGWLLIFFSHLKWWPILTISGLEGSGSYIWLDIFSLLLTTDDILGKSRKMMRHLWRAPKGKNYKWEHIRNNPNITQSLDRKNNREKRRINSFSKRRKRNFGNPFLWWVCIIWRGKGSWIEPYHNSYVFFGLLFANLIVILFAPRE